MPTISLEIINQSSASFRFILGLMRVAPYSKLVDNDYSSKNFASGAPNSHQLKNFLFLKSPSLQKAYMWNLLVTSTSLKFSVEDYTDKVHKLVSWDKKKRTSNPAVSPNSLMGSTINMGIHPHIINPVVQHPLKLWVHFRNHFLHQVIRLVFFYSDLLFLPYQTDTAFQIWHKKCPVFFKDPFL